MAMRGDRAGRSIGSDGGRSSDRRAAARRRIWVNHATFDPERLLLRRVASWPMALMLLALHRAGLVSVWYTAAPLPFRWALMGCVAVHALHMVAEQALLVGDRSVRCVRKEAGRWHLVIVDGVSEPALMSRPGWVPGPFAVLSFRTARGASDVLLQRGNVLSMSFAGSARRPDWFISMTSRNE